MPPRSRLSPQARKIQEYIIKHPPKQYLGVMPTRSPIPNPNAPSALQRPPNKVFKVGKVPIKRKMLPQTPVGMANTPTSAKYIPPRKTRKSNRL